MKIELLEKAEKARVRIVISKNKRGDDLVDIHYGGATISIRADEIEVNDVREYMKGAPRSGPKRTVRAAADRQGAK